jgi:uncharacterized C2H2 Zn-finger protein
MTNESESKANVDEEREREREREREESPYKCSICDRAFFDRAEFERHLNNMYVDQQSI